MLRRSLPLLFLLPVTAFATTPFNGFYAGINVGDQLGNFSVNQSANYATPTTTSTTLTNISNNGNNIYSNSLVGGLDIGYGMVFPGNFYFGVDGRGNLSNNNVNTTTSVTEAVSALNFVSKTVVNLNNNFSLAIKPGYLITDHSLAYILAGAACGHFSSKNYATYSQNAVSGGTTTPQIGALTSNNSTGYQTGGMLGIGLEQAVTPALAVRLEYNYTNYGNVKSQNASGMLSNATTGATIPGSAFNSFSKTAVQISQVLLGVSYYFG